MKPFTLLALLCLMAAPAWATHLLGGQIQAKNTTGNSYEITVQLLMDETNGTIAADQTGGIDVCLGDGTTRTVSRTLRRVIDQNISVNIYRFTYLYSGPGTYRITTNITSRTPMVNLDRTQEVLFSLQTTIRSTGDVRNTTPVVEPSPTFWQVGTNQRTTLSFRATDADGDSLSYAIARPLTNAASTCDAPSAVTQYQFPNDVGRVGTYKLNSRSGELVWDAPTRVGQYSTSVLIREWRNGVQIGETYVESVIRVQDRSGSTTPIPPYEPAVDVPAIITGNGPEADAGLVLTLSPNPAQSRLLTQIRSNRLSVVQLQLHDLSGRMIAEKALNQPSTMHEHTFGLESLPSGMYVLKANVNGRVVSRSFLKQ